MAVPINNIVIIIISINVTEIRFNVFRYVVVRDIEKGACVIRLYKVDVYGRYGEELLVSLLIITVTTAILIGSIFANL